MSQSLSKSAFSALGWTYAGRVARSVANLLIGALLARLLGPKPFGEIAIASLVVGIANLWTDAGFTLALVQAPDLTEVQIRFVFTAQLVIAALAMLVCFLIAGPMAATFHDPGVKWIMRAISPIFVLQALGQTSNGLLRRRMAFRDMEVAQMVSYLCCLLIGIPLAFAGVGVWTLIAAQLGQTVVFSVLQYARARHSILPCFDRSGMSLVRYGSKITAANTVNWSISNLDNAVVGHRFGPTSLGLYSRAFALATSPADSVVTTLQQVLFAACARSQENKDPVRRAYLASVSAVALIIFPIFWSMSACASTVVVGLYGDAWKGSVPLFRALSIAITLYALMALAGPILGAVNKVRQEVMAQLWSLAFAAVVFAVASRFSPTVFAWSVCAAYGFRFIVCTRPTLKYLEIRWRDVLQTMIGPAAVGLITTGVLFSIDRFTRSLHLRPTASLSLLIPAGAVVLSSVIFFFGHYVLSPQVVTFLQRGIAKMPAPAVSFLEAVAARQSPKIIANATSPTDVAA